MEGNKGKNIFFNKLKMFFSFSSNKLKTVIVIILIAVIVLIFSSTFKVDNEKSESVETKYENLSAMEYCETVENRLINVLKCVKGVGDVEVFVMVDASPTIKYLEETKESVSKDNSNDTKQTSIVLAKNGTLTYPIVTLELLPKITGVLVVATGAKDIKLKTTLINVVASVLNVNVSNVEVLEGK